MAAPAAAKTPGSTYCFYSTCHRVMTLAETRAAIGKPRPMVASHYDDPRKDRFNPSLITSSGELFRPGEANNAASPIYPDGTLVAVFAPATKRGAVVRINNAGPYWGNRLIDLSRGLADRLGVGGVSRVVVEVLAAPTPEEARYKRGRRYAPVPGFVGRVASIEDIRPHWNGAPGARGTMLAEAPRQAPTVRLLPIEVPFATASLAASLDDDRRSLALAQSSPSTGIAPTAVASATPVPAPVIFATAQSPAITGVERTVREIKGALAADLPVGTPVATRLELD